MYEALNALIDVMIIADIATCVPTWLGAPLRRAQGVVTLNRNIWSGSS
jgi:hypothetical protein